MIIEASEIGRLAFATRRLLDAANEQGLKLAAADLIDNHRNTNLARLREVGGTNIFQLFVLFEEWIFHAEIGHSFFEQLDIGDRLRSRLLKRLQDDLERINLRPGLIVPLSCDL